MERLGHYSKSTLNYIFEKLFGNFYNLISFLCIAIESFFKNFPAGFSVTKKTAQRQMYFTGYEALKLTAQVGFFMGIVVVTQITMFIKGLGGVNLASKVVIIALMREIIPLLMAIIAIARSGTAVTSELGLMKANEEILTIETLGIDYMYALILPRIVAFVISLMVITILAVFISIISGSFVIYFFQNASVAEFFNALFINMTFFDLAFLIIKTFLFGLTISIICCYNGLSVQKSTTEIPQVSTKAVLSSFFSVFVINLLLDGLVLLWQ